MITGLVGCKGHTGGMTPGRGLARAAGAIATAAVAGAVAGARRNRDRRDGDAWEEGEQSNVPELPMDGELSGAPLRLVSLPTGEAALAPELIVCDDARECVAVAAAECRAVAVRRERAAEVASASCETLPASYVPRCVHDLCRLESLSPEEVASNRAREAGAVEDSTNDASDEATSGGEVPAPPPSYE
ncbi:MAG: hypothetical protein MUE69_02300 [Myxococcota bacterium]|nr:hypothetical protein [Myxococcota bacterium]